MTCKICGYIAPQQSHSGVCPRCRPSYEKALPLIKAGKIWPAFKAAGVVPNYYDWECIHSIEVAGAKEKQSTEGTKRSLPSLGIPINEAKIDENIAKIEARTKAAANFEIDRIIKLRTAKKPTPEEAKQAAAAEQAFYDSTYTS